MQTAGARILVVDDDPELRRAIVRQLRDEGAVATEASDGVEATLALASGGPVDVVLTDLHMPRADGLTVIRAARSRKPPVPVVVLTASRSIEAAVAALRAGAADFLTKPCHESELLRVLERVLQPDGGAARREPAVAALGESARLRSTLSRLSQEADGEHPLLLRAEPGAGAEVLARLLVSASRSAGRPFIVLRPAVVDDHELGQIFEQAAAGPISGPLSGPLSGTLFVDEIAALSRHGQQLLLGELTRRPPRFRLIAVSRDSLSERARAGTFERELAEELERVVVVIPSLRDRREDIPMLAQHVLDEANGRLQRRVSLKPEVLAAMQGYTWPGNVAELARMIERMAAGNTSDPAPPEATSVDPAPSADCAEDPIEVTLWLDDGARREVTLERAGMTSFVGREVGWIRTFGRGPVAWYSADKITCIARSSPDTAEAADASDASDASVTVAGDRVRLQLRGGVTIEGWPRRGGVDGLLSETALLILCDGAFEYHVSRAHVLSLQPFR